MLGEPGSRTCGDSQPNQATIRMRDPIGRWQAEDNGTPNDFDSGAHNHDASGRTHLLQIEGGPENSLYKSACSYLPDDQAIDHMKQKAGFRAHAP
ncbi:unnamed protein product [Taenia asiatica]|uniref:Endostatin domain-containing protein n=1 Tax=Taenia asiatica TaxID=60517 RepID=A0A0R3W8D6_TAEAS|nr:unnamed protein product [Taenia asiatica]